MSVLSSPYRRVISPLSSSPSFPWALSRAWWTAARRLFKHHMERASRLGGTWAATASSGVHIIWMFEKVYATVFTTIAIFL